MEARSIISANGLGTATLSFPLATRLKFYIPLETLWPVKHSEDKPVRATRACGSERCRLERAGREENLPKHHMLKLSNIVVNIRGRSLKMIVYMKT